MKEILKLHVVADNENSTKTDHLRIRRGEEQHNPEMLAFNVNKLVTEVMSIRFYSRDWEDRELTKRRNVPKKILSSGKRVSESEKKQRAEKKRLRILVNSLFSITGVIDVVLSTYAINIVKGLAFDWGDIIPYAEKAIREHFSE